MPWIAQSGREAGEWVPVSYSIQGEPVTIDMEGQPPADTLDGRQVVFPSSADDITVEWTESPWSYTLDGRPVVYNVRSDEHGTIATISTTGQWLDDTPPVAFAGMPIEEGYAAWRSRSARARERAKELLLEHLSEGQRSDYKEHAYFDVPSSLEPEKRFFRLLHQNVSNIHVYARNRDDAYPPEGPRNAPLPSYAMLGISAMPAWILPWMGRGRSGRSYPTTTTEMTHRRTLCLVPRQQGAPIEDQLLAQKLLIEVDELTLWRTAR